MTTSPDRLDWRKSGQCANSSCIEVAFDGDRILVRDGKDPDGGLLTFTQAEWTAFIGGVKAGEFD